MFTDTFVSAIFWAALLGLLNAWVTLIFIDLIKGDKESGGPGAWGGAIWSPLFWLLFIVSIFDDRGPQPQGIVFGVLGITLTLVIMKSSTSSAAPPSDSEDSEEREHSSGAGGILGTIAILGAITVFATLYFVDSSSTHHAGAPARSDTAQSLQTLPSSSHQSASSSETRPSERDSIVREIQSRLNALGYNAGPVDGIVGPQTSNAVRAYQRDMELPIDGRLEPQLLTRLRHTGHSLGRNQRCVIKPVMTIADYWRCGITPPSN